MNRYSTLIIGFLLFIIPIILGNTDILSAICILIGFILIAGSLMLIIINDSY